MNKVRTRYAPSPTGYFHIGGARSALFNYLLAKKNKGDFILRIEDTDEERNVENGKESQLENLKWLGIIPDESYEKPNKKYGEYIQSKKLSVYLEYANQLIKEKKAYRCFCDNETLDKERELQKNKGNNFFKYPKTCESLSEQQIQEKLKQNSPFVIRIKSGSKNEWNWNDLIRGKISFLNEVLDDFVIIKSNKYPTYNFAVVIDDYQMQITHVLRGEEHISNTPKQLIIYDAFGWQCPFFAHLSLVTNHEGKKLSKRDKTIVQFIEEYKNLGYPPQAVINFLVFLGWTPTNNQEIFHLSELAQIFEIERISKAPAVFDVKKLNWFANQYFQKMDNDTYLNYVFPFLNNKYPHYDKKFVEYICLLFKKQLNFGQEIETISSFLFTDYEINKSLVERIFSINPKEFLLNFLNELILIPEWNENDIRIFMNSFSKHNNLTGQNFYMPIRILISGQEHGPELFKIIFIIGKEKIKEKLNIYKKTIKT